MSESILDVTDQYSTWRDLYLVVQGLFYFAQGIAMGAIFYLPSLLRDRGLNDLESIIIQAVIWLPWYLKVFFGILSDNVKIKNYGRRKPYVIVAGFLGIIGWLTLPTYTVFGPMMILSGILASFGTSMSDGILDALAVDVTPPRRRGAMQGVSWGSRGLGLGIAAVIVGLLTAAGEWFIAFAVPGVILGLACLFVILIKEVPLPEDFKRVPLGVLTGVFKQKNVQLCTLFQLFAGAGISILAILQTYLETGLGFDLVTVGIVFLIFSIGMFIGAIIFGLLGDKLSVLQTLPVTTILYTVIILSVLIIDTSDWAIAAIFFFLVGLANGGYEATQMRISMDNSPAIVGGTMYNFYNSISNLGQIAIGAILIAYLGEVVFSGNLQLGWQLAWVFLLLSLPVAYKLVKEHQVEGEGITEEAVPYHE
ncbi:MAG: MFS transporter [Candidatus Lokiarchaeota archaeon]|nr:MFS transporter [Candidatus Lokiarchaeota archaeon]